MATENREGSSRSPYTFENASEQTPRRFSALEALYDPWTIQHLDARGVTEGWHCLEVGGGSGSIAQRLCGRVGPTGHVLVTDIDTRFLDLLAGPRLSVQRHDIVVDTLPEAAFDLVHARLVLQHLPGREQALRKMVTALKPGGWIVIEDFDWIAMVPATATAMPVYSNVQNAVWHLMTQRGTDGFYGRQLWGRLRTQGLLEVEAEGRVCMYQGRSPGAQLLLAAVEQVRETLLRSGSVTEQEIDAYRELLADPDFALLSPVMMTSWGQRPAPRL